ncbi:MAG: putative lipid II flippase FtsW [Actinomycetota bacterium]|jgi:cell division protein FtsW|nr:putative lipid II flippase FtsW [Actinomycetota bacterium]
MTKAKGYAGGPKARYILLGSVAFLILGGLIMIYSAASVSDYVHQQDSAYHFKIQLQWIGIGVVLMYLASRFDYRKFRSLAWPIWIASCVALVGVLLVGVSRGGAQRWITIGGRNIQPSEYAKVACVLVAAHLLANHPMRTRDPKGFWLRLVGSVGVVAVLVYMQPDLGTTVSIVAAWGVVLILGGIRWSHLFAAGGIGGTMVIAAALLADYRIARVTGFLDPWSDPQGSTYQIVQSMLAFGSGGLTGVGLGMSRQKFFYLPAAHTDFIFAIIGEEFGLIGTLLTVAAFVLFTYAGFRIALNTRDSFGRLVAGGLTAMISIQAIMNMAAVTSLMPVTGIPLPLVSFGGSSMTFTMACIGVILSVSTYGAKGASRAVGSDKERIGAGTVERRRNSRSHLSGIDGGRKASRRRA